MYIKILYDSAGPQGIRKLLRISWYRREQTNCHCRRCTLHPQIFVHHCLMTGPQIAKPIHLHISISEIKLVMYMYIYI